MNEIDIIEEASASPAAGSARRRSTVSRRQVQLLLTVHGVALLALAFPSIGGLAALVVGYILTGGIGISLGYHRCFSHNAFGAHRVLRGILAVLGVLAFQGGPLTWIGFHRAHHKFSNGQGDPHSAARGFWWSHVGWALHKGPNGYRPIRMRSLLGAAARDPLLTWLERHNLALNLAALVVLAVALGPACALWAVPLRIVVVWHMTWLTNSIGHSRLQTTGDEGGSEQTARNVHWLAVLNFGEGLHRNHHAAPGNPCLSRSRGEIDPGYLVLAMLSKLRLVALRPKPSRAPARAVAGQPLPPKTLDPDQVPTLEDTEMVAA